MEDQFRVDGPVGMHQHKHGAAAFCLSVHNEDYNSTTVKMLGLACTAPCLGGEGNALYPVLSSCLLLSELQRDVTCVSVSTLNIYCFL